VQFSEENIYKFVYKFGIKLNKDELYFLRKANYFLQLTGIFFIKNNKNDGDVTF